MIPLNTSTTEKLEAIHKAVSLYKNLLDGNVLQIGILDWLILIKRSLSYCKIKKNEYSRFDLTILLLFFTGEDIFSNFEMLLERLMIWFYYSVTFFSKHQIILSRISYLKEYPKQLLLNNISLASLHNGFLGTTKTNQAYLPQKVPFVLDSSLLSPQSLSKSHI